MKDIKDIKDMKDMKDIKDFLFERNYIGDLPFTFEDLCDFIRNIWDDESESYIKMQQCITDNYGERAWSGFHGWIESKSNIDPMSLYIKLQKFPADRLPRILGSGSYGSVFTIGNDKIIKWFNLPPEKNDIIFYKYCLNNKSKYFPKIYKYNDKYCIMEKLKDNTQKCKLYSKTINKYFKINGKNTSIWDIVNQIMKGEKITKKDQIEIDKYIKNLSSDDKVIYEWFYNAMQEARDNGFIAVDMKSSNIGERSDGDIVWFDI